MGKVRIGTSGWNYDGWKGSLYPEKLASKDMFSEYMKHFDTVEINNTFYSLPSFKTVKNWYEQAPKKFIFSVKASRFITHNKKLLDPKPSFRKFFTRIEKLDDKLGPILFQLPPRFKYNGERLESFLKALPEDFKYTFEFREQSWLNEECYDLLRKYDVGLCIYDIRQFQSPEILTSKLVYIRLHGPLAKAYGGSYSAHSITKYAEKIKKWSKSNQVYCYFDNDQKAVAPKDANRLIKKLKSL